MVVGNKFYGLPAHQLVISPLDLCQTLFGRLFPHLGNRLRRGEVGHLRLDGSGDDERGAIIADATAVLREHLDLEGFETAMAEQRQRAKADQAAKAGATPADAGALRALHQTHGDTEFVGRDHDEIDATVLFVDEGSVVLDRTPFYAEAGGQIGDTGTIDGPGTASDACQAIVNDDEVSGAIALIQRGGCNFDVKVRNAADAGAVAVRMHDHFPVVRQAEVTGSPVPDAV